MSNGRVQPRLDTAGAYKPGAPGLAVTSIAADGDAVAFVAFDGHGNQELWVARECVIERVVAPGDRIGDSSLVAVSTLAEQAFRRGAVRVWLRLASGASSAVT